MPTGSVTTPDAHASLLLDTSAAVALVIQDHEQHAGAIGAIGGRRLGLAGHAWFETYSVLTRLPVGQRRSPSEILRILEYDFPATAFLSAKATAALGRELAALRISGGSVYDALVAAVAREQRLPLLTGDERARGTYEALGVSVEWL